MQADGVQRALAFTTSAFSSYSGCRQYREDIGRAREEVGSGAPEILKLRPYFDHPGFIEPMAANVSAALRTLPAALRTCAASCSPPKHPDGDGGDVRLRGQLREAAGARGRTGGRAPPSGTSSPEPERTAVAAVARADVVAHLEALHQDVCDAVVVVPIGFTSDHNEVRFDLDVQARARADELGPPMARAATVGRRPRLRGDDPRARARGGRARATPPSARALPDPGGAAPVLPAAGASLRRRRRR
jgi:ferrochelatase